MRNRTASAFIRGFSSLFICYSLFAGVFIISPEAAEAQSSPTAAAAGDAAPAANAPASIPLGEIAAQAEAASARLRDLGTTLSSDRIVETVTAELPTLTREIDLRLRESRKIAAQRPSLEMLSRLEMDWGRLRGSLSDWSRALAGRIARLE